MQLRQINLSVVNFVEQYFIPNLIYMCVVYFKSGTTMKNYHFFLF